MTEPEPRLPDARKGTRAPDHAGAGGALDLLREREYPGCGEPGGPVFLNSASYGLLPRRSRDAVTGFLERRGGPGGIPEEELTGILADARSAVARLVGCEPTSVTLSPNTSYGLNLAARLVASGAPGAIVMSDGEFPANVHPWLALEPEGFRVVRIPTDELGRPREEALLRALDQPGVRAVTVSAVQFATGYLADLERLGTACRDRGVLYCVDGIQMLGAAPLSVGRAKIDVLASGGQKWMCAPWGSGFTYMRPELRDELDPPMVSWLATEDAQDFDHLLRYRRRFVEDGRKLELASLGIQDYLGMTSSLEMLEDVGLEEVRSHIRRIQEPLVAWVAETEGVEAVTPLEAERRAGIFTFRVRNPRAVAEGLEEAGFVLSVRNGGMRISPHLYNTREQMERLVELLDETVAGRS